LVARAVNRIPACYPREIIIAESYESSPQIDKDGHKNRFTQQVSPEFYPAPKPCTGPDLTNNQSFFTPLGE